MAHDPAIQPAPFICPLINVSTSVRVNQMTRLLQAHTVSALHHSNTHVWMSVHTLPAYIRAFLSLPLSGFYGLAPGLGARSTVQTGCCIIWHPPAAAAAAAGITELHSWLQIMNRKRSGHSRASSTRLRGEENRLRVSCRQGNSTLQITFCCRAIVYRWLVLLAWLINKSEIKKSACFGSELFTQVRDWLKKLNAERQLDSAVLFWFLFHFHLKPHLMFYK